jgi:UDP-glucose 4-epimerase
MTEATRMRREGHIVVTGGAGFLGANIAKALAKRGDTVLLFDNLSRLHVRENVASLLQHHGDRLSLRTGDVRDAEGVAEAVRGSRAVIHLAAQVAVTTSVDDPVEDFEVNARGTLNVLRAAADAQVRRLVFASTGGALIGAAEPPVDEESVPRPLSPYGASKLAGEGYLHAFRGSYGLDAVALRFGNVYGPHSAHKKGAVTMFIKRSLRGEPLVIYGDGSASRDFIHVRDLSDGILAGLDAPAPPAVVHLASGRETPIGELARLILDATGADVPIDHRPARAGEVERNVAATALASRALGFTARVELRPGLEETVGWFRETGAWRS